MGATERVTPRCMLKVREDQGQAGSKVRFW